MTKLEDLSNELILCIWDQLFITDVLYSFSNLNSRINQLLLQFYALYKQLDLRHCSLSTFRYFSHQISTIDQWRLNLTSLKLGCRYRCSQSDLLANAVVQSFIAQYFAKQGKSCTNLSPGLFRLIVSHNKYLEPFFPQLKSLLIFQSTSMEEDTRDIFLHIVAAGSAMRTFIWRACSFQTHHSQPLFNWLLQRAHQLDSFRLENTVNEKAFELTYQQTLINDYRPHQHLSSLTIHLLNLSSLDALLHYLPRLQYLNVHISNMIEPATIADEDLAHPQRLRILILRAFKIQDNGRYQVEQLIEKFARSLESLALSLYHCSRHDPGLYYNGSSLQMLCEKLPHLQSIQFAIRVQFFQKATNGMISHYTRTFSTPYWLNGPFGCKEVCVDFHQLYSYLQMFSLPCTFADIELVRTIDLVQMQFNTSKETDQRSTNLPRALECLWTTMTTLFVFLTKDQRIPLSFLEALQHSRRHGKKLNIYEKRGIMPDNVDDQMQLVHFNTLELNGFTTNDPYDLQELLGWIRLLPNIRCLDVNVMELKHWFSIADDTPSLRSLLQHIDRLYVDCFLLINAKINEEIMKPLLDFLIDRDRFPRLRAIRFGSCKNISSAWINIDQWLDFFLIHITEHQLHCIRFDIVEKEHEVTDLHTADQTITTTNPTCTFDIHRFIHANHVALWIDRK